MNKGQLRAWGRTSLILSAFVLSQVFVSSAFAKDDGTKLTGDDCSGCHNSGAATVMILGPDQVLAHEEVTYTLEISGGGPWGTGASEAAVGGLAVAALDGGVLSLVGGEPTYLNTGEVVHTTPKLFSSGTVSWDFIWTAPATPGDYDLFARGVDGNGGSPQNQDWAGFDTLTVTVSVIPIPAAAILFGSALGVLGWVRRRVA